MKHEWSSMPILLTVHLFVSLRKEKGKKRFKQKTISFYCYGSWCTRDIDYHVYIVSHFWMITLEWHFEVAYCLCQLFKTRCEAPYCLHDMVPDTIMIIFLYWFFFFHWTLKCYLQFYVLFCSMNLVISYISLNFVCLWVYLLSCNVDDIPIMFRLSLGRALKMEDQKGIIPRFVIGRRSLSLVFLSSFIRVIFSLFVISVMMVLMWYFVAALAVETTWTEALTVKINRPMIFSFLYVL